MSDTDERPEISEKRDRFIETFADWMIKTGLSPLDYELVEEHRADGVVAWYFQKRINNDAIDNSAQSAHLN